jgi:MoaA/NifB/PqqE/SkfB family radical SAM enzyme
VTNPKNKLNLPKKVLGYVLCRRGLAKAPSPINLTFSVTNMCQSRCKTCNIWRTYLDRPERFRDELTIDEIKKTFRSIGQVYFFNISGGEPFLRKDITSIVQAACRFLRPAVIHTPTNGLLPARIEEKVRAILEIIREDGRGIHFTIKPSFDGIGSEHDDIRGVPGNFEKVLDTIGRLKRLQREYPNLEVGLGTIISKFNLPNIGKTAAYARNLGVDSYISEIAEQRTELFNVGEPITPDADEYRRAIEEFNAERNGMGSEGKVSASTLAFRRVYYEYAIRTMKEQRQVLPCYGGISNVHISPYGDVWPCCVLGYDRSMGNLRDADYDFNRIWQSAKAAEIRHFIAKRGCHCPLANQAYSNILCNPSAMAKVLRLRTAAKWRR